MDQKQSRKKRKRLLILLILLVLIIIGSGLWFLIIGATKQESFEGITFEIPKNWSSSETDFGMIYNPPKEEARFFTIAIKKPVDFMAGGTAEKELQDSVSAIKESEWLDSDVNQEKVTIDGKQGVKLVYDYAIASGESNDEMAEKTQETSIFLVYGKNLIEFDFSTDRDGTNTNKFNKIMESVKL